MLKKYQLFLIILLLNLLCITMTIKKQTDTKIQKTYFQDKPTITINYQQSFLQHSLLTSNLTIDDYTKVQPENLLLWDYTITQNFKTNYPLQENDSLELWFMNTKGKIYIISYQKEPTQPPLPKDDYLLLLKLNNTIYTTNTIYKIT